MYAFLSTALILAGLSLIIVIVVRKMPALAELPDEPSKNSISERLLNSFSSARGKIDWRGFKKVGISLLISAVSFLRKFFHYVARLSDKFTHNLWSRLNALSRERPLAKHQISFLARIKKRKAFVEEEKKLIDSLARDPDNTDDYRRLGNLYAIAGNITDAKAAFSEVLRRLPNDDEAKKRLEELGNGNGNGNGGGSSNS